jgi:diguanylate cyclase (GGDEF)-like protein/PAS domain S-box-containing protein
VTLPSALRAVPSEDDCGYLSGTVRPYDFRDPGSESQCTSGRQADPPVRAQDILSCIGDAIISADISGRITYLNPAAEKMTGWSIKEALGLPMAEVMKITDLTTCESPRHPPATDQGAVSDLTVNRMLIRRDGMGTAIEDSVAPIHDRKGRATGAVIVFRALTEEVRAKAHRMSHLALYDVLTDLPNRMLLKDRLGCGLALASRYGRPLAVLFLDLDHFKQVNDSTGHAMGDRVLQSMAGRLLACVRSSDTVCRYGGDEFVILLSEIDHSRNLILVAQKILAAIAAPLDLTPDIFHITASIGVSIFPQDGRDGDTLIQSADAAMYAVKQNGRNSFGVSNRRLKT